MTPSRILRPRIKRKIAVPGYVLTERSPVHWDRPLHTGHEGFQTILNLQA